MQPFRCRFDGAFFSPFPRFKLLCCLSPLSPCFLFLLAFCSFFLLPNLSLVFSSSPLFTCFLSFPLLTCYLTFPTFDLSSLFQFQLGFCSFPAMNMCTVFPHIEVYNFYLVFSSSTLLTCFLSLPFFLHFLSFPTYNLFALPPAFTGLISPK